MPAIDPLATAVHGPVRTCLGCRTRRRSDELVRLTRRARVVAGGPSDGRGAWLCRDRLDECLAAAIRHRGFDRAWRIRLDGTDHDEIRSAVGVTTNAATADDAVGMTTGKG